MIKAENLTKSYGGLTLFSGISFQIDKGERCSFVGRNGSGKSTLFKILIGEESADEGVISMPKSYRIGYLHQHIRFTQPTVQMEAALCLPEEERETPYRVEVILSGLGFEEGDFSKPPESFSGGFQLRIQLAKTLAEEPDCLLLDEPTNYLDIISIRWLEKFLKNWKSELIIISHDRAFLDSISTHTMGIHRNKLQHLSGTTQEYYNHILLEEESQEKARLKIEKKKEHVESYINRFGAKATKAKQAQSRLKAIEKLPSLEKLTQLDNLDFQFQTSPFPGRCMLEARNLSFAYEGMEDLLISDFSLEVEPGERLAVIGKNGRGKSTLLKLLANELVPLNGEIKRSENLAVGYFGQTNVANLNPSLSIEEEISLSNPDLPFSEIKRICGIMMFSQKQSEKKIRVLSGGEKSRVLLGKILAAKCNLLLLDEPTNHLDLESVEALVKALETFPGSVIIVSHAEEILHRIPEKLILCHEDRQEIFLGNYGYFLEKIGWNDEGLIKAKSDKSDKKAQKRERAEKIQARSKELNPIKKKIERLEAEIEFKELELSDLQRQLESDPGSIAEAAKAYGTKQKEIDLLFQELEIQYEKHEQVMQSYHLD
ncbi:uncharacterized ABC transporter ATP-binding protein YheS [Waddlia chondrophila 2032/99]|uniref:ABC transporter, ATPase subunit n=2 Tax=Waddlia chondrophila TaxID=71667 RepID=D6YVV0_WADCW|nr:ABC-F family ATP-binding cassette domain-containing protein [Waddlia chondrophila]ADI38261.1 ABC transporter, ATPase subunit [Waddlia chondrophila WSU 86-1044]CCB91342.1 uncharacterized ABC transporter ATP-binding protein YheS [Waddlia chondrophila 2032/99]